MKRSFFKIKNLMIFIVLILILENCTVLSQFNHNKIKSDIVLTGLDVLSKTNFKILTGKRVGLITNQTGLDKNLRQNIDLFKKSNNVELNAVFSPEHGFKGTELAGKKILKPEHKYEDLVFHSLYGETKVPSSEMLKDLDILVFDIQDIGIRSYTYISTMGLAMKAAANHNIEFIVLDRPNPIGGLRVEGNKLDIDYTSFIGMFPIPYVYGLTSGELANFINEEVFLAKDRCKLKVVNMINWSRDKLFEDTYLNWVPTSPHVPTMETPYYMVSTGILGELGVFSIGVGYTIPFQVIAAPWIDSKLISDEMNKLNLEGVNFRPINYTPYYSIYSGIPVNGVQIYFTNLKTVNLYSLQFYFLEVHNKFYPEKNPFLLAEEKGISMYDKAIGTSLIRKVFMNQNTYESVEKIIKKDVDSFRLISKEFYLYE